MKSRSVLRDLREARNLTQKDIAEVISVTASYYGMIEQGVRTPTLDVAKRIAIFFNTTIDRIFFDHTNN